MLATAPLSRTVSARARAMAIRSGSVTMTTSSDGWTLAHVRTRISAPSLMGVSYQSHTSTCLSRCTMRPSTAMVGSHMSRS